MAVIAVLNAASTDTVVTSIDSTIAVTPEPTALLGLATVCIYGEIVDLENARIQYSYMAYQTYTGTDGSTAMAQTTGTSEWIAIAGVSQDFPNTSVTATVTSAFLGSDVTFSIVGTTTYTKTTPGLYTVTTE